MIQSIESIFQSIQHGTIRLLYNALKLTVIVLLKRNSMDNECQWKSILLDQTSRIDFEKDQLSCDRERLVYRKDENIWSEASSFLIIVTHDV